MGLGRMRSPHVTDQTGTLREKPPAEGGVRGSVRQRQDSERSTDPRAGRWEVRGSSRETAQSIRRGHNEEEMAGPKGCGQHIKDDQHEPITMSETKVLKKKCI